MIPQRAERIRRRLRAHACASLEVLTGRYCAVDARLHLYESGSRFWVRMHGRYGKSRANEDAESGHARNGGGEPFGSGGGGRHWLRLCCNDVLVLSHVELVRLTASHYRSLHIYDGRVAAETALLERNAGVIPFPHRSTAGD